MKRFTVFIFVYLLNNQTVLTQDTEPTFRYVTSYNKEGRFMTKDDIEKYSVNVLKPIIFIINGLTNADKKGDSWSTDLRDAYVEKLVHNVFIVDWNLPASEESASINIARSVGLTVADFIATIFNKTGEDYLNIHLVGLSLGSEVASSAAGRLRESSGRKINRITGLDPAYYLISNKGKLSPEDADFVDVVHTNLNRKDEQLKQTGHVDFYIDLENGYGSLNSTVPKSAALFARSVDSNEIKATKCDNIDDFRKGSCTGGAQVTFGENVSTGTKGKYFLKL